MSGLPLPLPGDFQVMQRMMPGDTPRSCMLALHGIGVPVFPALSEIHLAQTY